jgi:uncharacterized protein (TIGR00369 family)
MQQTEKTIMSARAMEQLAGRPVTFGCVDLKTATSMSGIEFLRSMMRGTYPAPPIAEVLNFLLVEADVGRAVFEGIPSNRFRNPLGTVHGGWMSTMLDSALGCAVHSTLKAGQGFTTVDLAVSFVRAVHESTGKMRCEAKVIHVGGRIATAEGRLIDAEGRLYAHGTTTCLVMSAPTG